jgi:DNA-binding NarL/FixJ family response regulator
VESRRVLIVDPHLAFRSASRALLETEGLEIVAALDSYDGALERVGALRPDVALIAVSLDRPEGLELARRLASLTGPPEVVLMSAAASDVLLAASVGACAFVAKSDVSADLIACVAAKTAEVATA